jgi:hypothetical protein
MQKIKQLYRSNYEGEIVTHTANYTGGEWVKQQEYIPSAVQNIQLSGKAVVLGNGPSRLALHPYLYTSLTNHRGGLLASGVLQTYGCNAILRDFQPDFTVANDALASELVNKGLCDENIIYANSNTVLAYPGKFYMIPQNPNWDAGAMAAYLACFDGHKTVYLMGFDLHAGEPNTNYNIYAGTNGYLGTDTPSTEKYLEQTMLTVMNTYPNVDFVRVMPTPNFYMPESWKYQLNLRQILFKDFVLEVDL